jgi:myo-inositol-1(or 4)-monophosphatase
MIDPLILRDIAESVALSAGRLVRRKWSEPREVSEKGYRDYVTDADYASQEFITRTIRAAFPNHGFLTEEDDPSLPEDGPVIWVIDPIDGTSNYSRQVPNYCVSIGAAVRQEPQEPTSERYLPVAGAIYDPMRDELFSAAAGSQSTLNGRQIAVSQVDDMSRAIVSMDWMVSAGSGCSRLLIVSPARRIRSGPLDPRPWRWPGSPPDGLTFISTWVSAHGTWPPRR